MGFLGVRAGSLSNKTVVITGASAGLGATLAVECAQQGARLVILARNAERLEAVARECEQLGGEVLTVVGDVAIAEDGKRLVEAAIERFGSIDYLVANAGVSMWTEFAAIEDVALFRKLMEVNYLGAVHCVHPALPHLKKSKGLFVAISSIQGQVGVPLHTGYSASKHALQGFCDALRMEVAESGVGVMTVLLHWLKGTELRQRALGKDGKALGDASREHRAGAVSLEKAARAIVRGMLKRRQQLYVPRRLRLLALVHALWPALAEWVVKGKVAREEG